MKKEYAVEKRRKRKNIYNIKNEEWQSFCMRKKNYRKMYWKKYTKNCKKKK